MYVEKLYFCFSFSNDTYMSICFLLITRLVKFDLGWTQRVFGDFAKVVASCNNLVSADVPQMLAKISHEAGKDYGEEFKRISPEKALEKLKSDKTKTAELFAVFLQKHGHRCLHEV